MGSISHLSGNYVQSILNTALQNSGLTSNTSANGVSGLDNSIQQDTNQLSPFAQLLSTLQQLQQSDPSKYTQVTQQIATNLQAASQTATTSGNTTAASQLSQLATDFTNASQSGQLPNVQDLAEALGAGNNGGGGHHHHHHGGSDSGNSTNSALNQLLSALQSSESQSASSTATSATNSLNPFQIISSTLQSAGVTTSGG
jgi:chromosome condensin MukBEF ATPase and DNA-binding subunit MukB